MDKAGPVGYVKPPRQERVGREVIIIVSDIINERNIRYSLASNKELFAYFDVGGESKATMMNHNDCYYYCCYYSNNL